MNETQQAPKASQAPQAQQNTLALVKKDVVDVVEQKVREFQKSGELALPANYSAANALKSAWLILQSTVDKDKRPALQVCTRDSIANSLLDMVVQGLNPVKRQGYFIVYGNQLTFQRSYFGDEALVLRVKPGSSIWHGVVYTGDEFEYQMERGQRKITKHVQQLANIKPENIQAAYCMIEDKDGNLIHTEIMTIDQIHRSWQQSRQYNPNGGNTPHYTFPDQMALRTVIRRACKAVINSSSDDYLLLQHVNRSDEDQAEAEAEAEAAEHANGEIIDVAAQPESEPVAGPEAPPPVQQAQQAQMEGPGF